MNLDLARKILSAVEQRSDGSLILRNRKMVREAELMQEEGWVQLSERSRKGSRVVARLTETGKRLSRLFKDDAISQRLRDAFSPRSSTVRP